MFKLRINAQHKTCFVTASSVTYQFRVTNVFTDDVSDDDNNDNTTTNEDKYRQSGVVAAWRRTYILFRRAVTRHKKNVIVNNANFQESCSRRFLVSGR